MFHKIRRYFVAGLLVLGPLFISVVFIGYLVRLTDQFIVNPLFWALPFEFDRQFKVFLTKLVLGIFVVFFVSLTGFAAQRFIFRKFFSSWEAFLGNIPLINKIYFPVKDIAEALFGDKSGVFKRAVYLEYPRAGIYALGFVTQEEKRWDVHEKTGKEIVSVFVPSPPNPATGNFVFVPKEQIIDANITIEEAVKLVISGGAAVPPLKKP